MGENVGIIYVCVVFFIAIKAMGNVTRVAPMDQISGTLLRVHMILLPLLCI